jgi:hypothetical protein
MYDLEVSSSITIYFTETEYMRTRCVWLETGINGSFYENFNERSASIPGADFLDNLSEC